MASPAASQSRDPTKQNETKNMIQDGVGKLPSAVKGPLVWTSVDSPDPDDYISQLDAQAVAEVQEALHIFKTFELDGDRVAKCNFPLPRLQPQLEQAALQVHRGRGFAVIRGLDPSCFSAEDNVVAFLGIAGYFGSERGIQNSDGDILVHVTDAAEWDDVPYERRHGIHGNSALPFHCDMGTDILALHIRQVAKSGGATYLASAWAIYNEIMRDDSSVLETLCKPDWPIQVSARLGGYMMAPLVAFYDEKIVISLDPATLGIDASGATTTRPSPSLPVLSPTQRHALAVLNEVAQRCAVRLEYQPGDMLFINNWALLHARDPFANDPDTSSRRHLVRIWMSNPELAWSIPPTMALPREAAFGHCRHTASEKGLWYKGKYVEPRYPLHPSPQYKLPKYTYGSAAFILEDDDGEDWQSYFAHQ